MTKKSLNPKLIMTNIKSTHIADKSVIFILPPLTLFLKIKCNFMDTKYFIFNYLPIIYSITYAILIFFLFISIYFILFYFILFWFILFYFILFYFILFYFIYRWSRTEFWNATVKIIRKDCQQLIHLLPTVRTWN